MATDSQREHLAGLMDWTHANRALIGYLQRRPMHTARGFEQDYADSLRHGNKLLMDCSEACTWIARLAGLRDPNGKGYDGSGFTGTMLAELEHYTDPHAAMTGALVVFGPGTGEHVAMVRHPGKDPVLWSHGSDAGPLFVPLSMERAAHRAPVTFLSVAPL